MSKKDTLLFLVVVIILTVVAVVFLVSKILEKKQEIISTKELSEEIVGGGFLPFEPVVWDNPEKPMQSPALEGSEIPKQAIKLEVSVEKGFVPSSFEVKKGEKVVLVITGKDRWSHSFKFRNKELEEVAVGLGAGQTRAITFYAPNEAGEYEFFCDIVNHESMGEKGAMRVK